MERPAQIYIGNAAKFTPGNLHIIEGCIVSDSGKIYYNGEEIKPFRREGYRYVSLPINGKNKNCKVHRIVATTFRDICGEFNEVVNHLDEDKENNSASNLRWTSNSENLSWGTIEERRKKTIENSREIRKIVKDLYSKNHIVYHNGIKIKRLKTCYKIVDKKNNIYLYTQGKEFVFNEKRGTTKMFE